jgi:hypothetical protein
VLQFQRFRFLETQSTITASVVWLFLNEENEMKKKMEVVVRFINVSNFNLYWGS